MTGRFIGKTYKEYQSKCIENLKNGKQIDDFLTCTNVQKRPQAPKHIFWGLGYEKSGNQVPPFENVENIYEICSRIFCAGWIIRFSKRGHEVPK